MSSASQMRAVMTLMGLFILAGATSGAPSTGPAACFDGLRTEALTAAPIAAVLDGALGLFNNGTDWWAKGTCDIGLANPGASLRLATGLPKGTRPPLRWRPSQLQSVRDAASAIDSSGRAGAASLPSVIPDWARPLAGVLAQAARLASMLVPVDLSLDNVGHAFLSPRGAVQTFHRLRFDVLQANAGDTDRGTILPLLEFTRYTLPAASEHDQHLDCDSIFADQRSLREVRLTPVMCEGGPNQGSRRRLHSAEGALVVMANLADAAVQGVAALAGYDLEEHDSADLLSRFVEQPWPVQFQSSHRRAIPLCSFDLPALDVPSCLRVQCTSASACGQNPQTLVILATRRFDAAVLTLLCAALVAHWLRPLAARSQTVQLFLAACFGLAIVTCAVLYFIMQTLTQTRIGKVGAYGALALGGFTALWQGALQGLTYWFFTEFLSNGLAQAIVGVCSVTATVMCYRVLGDRLSQIIHVGLAALSLGLVGAAVARNPEVSAAAMLLFASHRVALRLVSLVLRLAFASRASAIQAANRGATPVPQRRTGTSSAGQTPGYDGGDEILISSDSDTGYSDGGDDDMDDGCGPALERDPRFDYNDPVDNLPTSAFVGSPSPSRRTTGSRRVAPAQYSEQGSHHTRAELRKLAAEMRRRPGHYASRLQAPNEMMRFASVN